MNINCYFFLFETNQHTRWGADKRKLQLQWQEAPPPAGVLITKTEIDDWGGGGL